MAFTGTTTSSPSPTSALRAEARRLRHLGDYSAAIALVDNSGSSESDVLLAAEKLWSLVQRGNDGVALSAVRSFLSLPQSAPSMLGPERDLLRLFEAFLLIHVDGAVLDALNTAADVWTRRYQYQISEPDADIYCEIVCLYHRIQLAAATYRERDENTVRSAAAEDLLELIERPGYSSSELLDVLLLYSNAAPPADAIERLRALAVNCADSTVRPLALLRCAELMLDAGESADSVSTVLSEAEAAAAVYNHRHVALEAALVRLSTERLTPNPAAALDGLRDLYTSHSELMAQTPRLQFTFLQKLINVSSRAGRHDLIFASLREAEALALTESRPVLLLHIHLSAVLRATLATGHFGKVAEACEASLRFLDAPGSGCQLRAMRALFLQAFGMAYERQGDGMKALHYGREAYSAFVELGWKVQISRQSGFLGQALILSVGAHNLHDDKSDEYASAKEELLSWIRDDLTEGSVEEAAEKYVSLVLLDAKCIDIHGVNAAGVNAAHWLAEAENLGTMCAPDDLQRFSASLEQVRALVHVLNGRFPLAERAVTSAAAQYSTGADRQSPVQYATTQMMLGMLKIDHYQGTRAPVCLDEADPLLHHAAATWTQLGELDRTAHCQYYLGCVWEYRCQCSDARPDSFSQAMHYYAAAQRACDQLRRELSILPPATAVESLRRNSVLRLSQKIAAAAFGCSYAQGAIGDAWLWSQRSKARGLADLLGSSVQTPPRLLASLQPCEVSLLDEEQSLLREIGDTPDAMRQSLRHRLDLLRASMLQSSRLRPIIALRDGEPIVYDDLKDFPPPRTVCFDYMLDRYGGIFLFALSSEHGVRSRKLDITVPAIEQWKATHMNSTDLEYNRRVFRKLVPLVQPIFDLCEPEDTLVLCPAGVLHGIPLHAIPVGKQILLERNPVVYSSSFTVLQLCLSRSNSARPSRVAALGVPGDRPHALSTATAVAALFGSTPTLTDDATIERLLESLQTSGVVYFHGHAEFHAKDPMESCIRLADGPLTARAALTARIAPCDVALIACSSGEQDISLGDEPLGLIPALLIAGATSVVATLWPIRDEDGGSFSKAFFGNFKHPDSSNMIDMARALRLAVLEIRSRPETAAPFFWAAFVFHGAWLRPCIG